VAEGMSKECQQPTATPDRTNERLGRNSISLGKMAEPNELPFKVVSGVGVRNHVLDGCAHWCQLENTVKIYSPSGKFAERAK